MVIQNTIIVSPSGNFYGSEQVLYNFLCHTTQHYKVYVPKSSVFLNKLEVLKKHSIVDFSDVRWLYLRLFFKLLLGSYKTLYINEGGHVKYAKLIAQFLGHIRVVLHIRLLEDCKPGRLGQLPPNLLLVGISDYISSELKNYAHYKIYDPLDVVSAQEPKLKKAKSKYCIGIIGRVSETKGLVYYEAFFEYLRSHPFNKSIEFQFYGDVLSHDTKASDFYKTYHQSDLPVVFKGFVSDQEELYAQLDMVLHLNPNEPLGRIGLESWARRIPFLSFSSGGAGEINRRLGMEAYSVHLEEGWEAVLKSRIESLKMNTRAEDLESAKKGVIQHFGVSRYVSELEQLFKS